MSTTEPPPTGAPSEPYYPSLNRPVGPTAVVLTRARWVVLLVAAAVPVLVGVAVWQFVSHADSDPSRTVPEALAPPAPEAASGPSDPPSAAAPPNRPAVLSAAGFAAMRAAVREQTGSTAVFGATIYPAYAVVEVPTGSTGHTQRFHRWDGVALTPLGPAATLAAGDRVDLATVRPAVVANLARHARRVIVPRPTAWYVLVRTDPDGAAPSLYAYASDDAGHGGYLLADLTGKVLRRTTW